MTTQETAQDFERLTPTDRDDVIATFSPLDCLEFVEAVKNDHPDTFDKVVDDFTQRVWVGGQS